MPFFFFKAKPESKSKCESVFIAFPAGVDVNTATQYVNQHCQGDYEHARPIEPQQTPEILCQQLPEKSPDHSGQTLGGENEDDSFDADDSIDVVTRG